MAKAGKRASGFRPIGSPYYLGGTMQQLVTSRMAVHCTYFYEKSLGKGKATSYIYFSVHQWVH